MTEHPAIPDAAPAGAAASARLAAAEAQLGVRLDYLREMAAAGSPVLAKIEAVAGLDRASISSDLPLEIRSFATLGALQADSSAECVQIHVNLDRAVGINPALLQAALDGRAALLPGPLALAWRFGRAVAENDAAMDDLRQDLEARYGRPAIMDLAFAIAVARFYPTVKRVLGYAPDCSPVRVRAA